MYLIIGLGNPGRQYARSRHNVGFMAIDVLSESFSIPVNRIEHKAICGKGQIGQERVILVKPQTFMNLSGESVRSLMDYYRIAAKDLLVIYDDMALDIGRIRIRERGSSGGHNGIKSIVQHVGTEEFARIRIGIGEPPHNGADYVLEAFPPDEKADIDVALQKMDRIVETIIEKNVPFAMNLFNGQTV